MKVLYVICILLNAIQIFMYATGKRKPNVVDGIFADVCLILLWISKLIE